MTGLERIRRRVPLIVFLLLLVLVLLTIGFACACIGDQPIRAAERAAGGLATPALIVMWATLANVLALASLVVGRRIGPMSRASPVVLQCFLR